MNVISCLSDLSCMYATNLIKSIIRHLKLAAGGRLHKFVTVKIIYTTKLLKMLKIKLSYTDFNSGPPSLLPHRTHTNSKTDFCIVLIMGLLITIIKVNATCYYVKFCCTRKHRRQLSLLPQNSTIKW